MKILKFENPQLHVKAWLCFILYERFFVFYYQGTTGTLINGIAVYAINITIFYFNAHIVLPNSVKGSRVNYGKLIVLMAAEVIAYLVIKLLIVFVFKKFHWALMPHYTTFKLFLYGYLSRLTNLLGLSTGYWFALSTYYNRQKISALEREKLREEIQTQTLRRNLLLAENAYLRSQINPHFLLNTLGFIYNSVLKYSEQVAESFMTLADIMRYALTDSGPDGKVWLEDELANISNFIRLNQARFNQRLQVSFEIDGDPSGLRVPPLILMTLTENVFKYGDLFNKAEPATIATRIDGNLITFATQNSRKKNILEQSHGIGLQNIKSRLADFDYSLNIEENDQRYIAILEIKL
jgi:sensor histidine kinase YesM